MVKDYEIVNGVYKGPKHYPVSLDLGGTSVTDLGSLKSVGGYLDLWGTPITDLGSLNSVGSNLYLRGTIITSLGSLKSVGGGVFTKPFNYLRLQDLKDLIQEIEGSSIVTLVERLHVEEDPFLKRVIERALHEV